MDYNPLHLEFLKSPTDRPLTHENVDVAFFPLDPRQGSMFEAGANYFILSAKPRLLIPMHYFRRSDIAVEYARTASCRTTEVLAMPGIGDCICVQLDESGFINISFPKENPVAALSGHTDSEAENEVDLEDNPGENPFSESDLPLSQLADEEKEDES